MSLSSLAWSSALRSLVALSLAMAFALTAVLVEEWWRHTHKHTQREAAGNLRAAYAAQESLERGHAPARR